MFTERLKAAYTLDYEFQTFTKSVVILDRTPPIACCAFLSQDCIQARSLSLYLHRSIW